MKRRIDIEEGSLLSIACRLLGTFSYFENELFIMERKGERTCGQLNNSAPARTYFSHECVSCATCSAGYRCARNITDLVPFQIVSTIWQDLSSEQYSYFSSCFWWTVITNETFPFYITMRPFSMVFYIAVPLINLSKR